MRILILLMLCLATTAMAGEITVDVDAETSRDAHIRPLFWATGAIWVEEDTVGMAWVEPAATDHGGTAVTTGLEAVATAWNVGNIVITWDDGPGAEFYWLRVNINDTGWQTIDDRIAVGVEEYIYTIGDTPVPERGVLDFRMYSLIVSTPDTTEAAVLPSYHYNQCTMVNSQYHAVESVSDYEAGTEGITVSAVDSTLHIGEFTGSAEEDTVGHENIGGSVTNLGTSAYANKIVMPENGLITEITYYMAASANVDVKVALMTFASGVGDPLTTLATGELDEPGGLPAGWVTIDLDAPYYATEGTEYWIAVHSENGGQIYWEGLPPGNGVTGTYTIISYAAFPGTGYNIGSVKVGRRYASYATYLH